MISLFWKNNDDAAQELAQLLSKRRNNRDYKPEFEIYGVITLYDPASR